VYCLNHTEKNQLLVEAMLLEQYIAGMGEGCKAKHKCKKQSGKFAQCKTKHDPLTLKYLVQHSWGLSNSYLSDLRKQQRKLAKTSGPDEGFEAIGASYCTTAS